MSMQQEVLVQGSLKNAHSPGVLNLEYIREKFFGTEFYQLFGLLVLTFLISYFTPRFLNQIYLLFLLALFINSKSSYFWLAFFLVLRSAPFGLFAEAQAGLTYGLPLFTFIPGISLNFYQLFIFAALFKAYRVQSGFRYIVSKQLSILFFYFAFLLFIAIAVHQISLSSVLYDLRRLMPYLFLFILPRLINNRESLLKLLYLIAPFVIIHFIDAALFALNGGRYITMGLDRNEALGARLQTMGSRFIMFGGMFQYLFLTFFFSFILLILNKRNRLIKTLFVIMAFMIIIAGGFRSWFLIFSIGLAVYLSVVKNKLSNAVYVFAVLLLITNLILDVGQESVFYHSYQRAAGVFEIFQPGSQAAASIEWKAEGRLPGQLELIRQNPIIGWGFTENRGDPDVGNFGMLVEMGLIGFIIYLFLWIAMAKMYLNVSGNPKIDDRYRKIAKVLLAGFIGLLLSHFTTNQIFGIGTFSTLFVFYLFVSDFFMKEAYRDMYNKST